MIQRLPILEISKYGLADTIRADKNRVPGMCARLLNTAPNLSGIGERIRRGYTAYTDVTAPTGAQILKVATIQNPTQEDVHVWFASSSGQKIYVNPWWNNAGAKQSTNLNIAESIASFVWAGSVGASSIVITGADAAGFSAVADYYKYWIVKNITQDEYVYILSNTYSAAAGGTITITTLEVVDATGLNWATGNSLALYRNFHDAPTFAPTYNTTLTDPPEVNASSSIIRLSGGKSSAEGNTGIHISPYIDRSFFPVVSSTYVFKGTYASKRRLSAPQPLDAYASFAQSTVTNGLEVDNTYWVGLAFVYDGFQIGELYQYAYTDFPTGADWTYNFLKSTAAATNGLDFQCFVRLSKLNKRATGIAIYVAKDPGDTHLSGRATPFYFVAHLPFTTTTGYGANWTYAGVTTQAFRLIFSFDANIWDARGNTYVLDTGYIESPTDTMYAYSNEIVSGIRHYLTNVYVSSKGETDRQNLFTNPIGGNVNVNAGVTQPDVFSNEDGFYKLRVEPTLGTKLTGCMVTGIQELLVIKDRGILIGREYLNPSGYPSINWQILSHDRGSATLNQIVSADDGWIYFAGYDDIHRYRQGIIENLIEEQATQNDWLYTYREAITKASKEGTVVFWLPERVVVFDIAQTSGQQYAFYPGYGWRQIRFKQVAGVATQFFKWMTHLQSGMVVGTTSDATAEFKKFSDPATNMYYYSDGGTAIPYLIDTGDFIPSGDEAMNTALNYFGISRTFDSPSQGTLDVLLYKDGSLLRTYASRPKTSAMLRIASMIGDPRLANSWRLVINSNSDPETLNAGNVLTMNKIFLYGEHRARGKKATELTTGNTGSVLGDGVSNTIAGKLEITVNSTDTTGTFDIPFTKSYTGTEGAGIPSYRFEMEPAYVIGSDHSTVETVTIISKSLTQIVLRSSSDLTLVKFRAVE